MKKGPKIALFVLGPLVMLGGGGFYAVYAGLVEVPGLPKKEAPKAEVVPEKQAETAPKTTVAASVPPVRKPAKPKAPKVEVITPDPAKGDRKLAALWNEMETDKLLELTKDWREDDLARVLLKMDVALVADYLAALPDPKRASSISRRIRELASVPAS